MKVKVIIASFHESNDNHSKLTSFCNILNKKITRNKKTKYWIYWNNLKL